MSKQWVVISTKSVDKQAIKLSQNVLLMLHLLFEDLANQGPALPEWPNYGKLHGKKNVDKRHCHLQKGKPTYVCCWEVIDKKRKIIEVYYVGTHEKAPY
jgi:hypothetical protein